MNESTLKKFVIGAEIVDVSLDHDASDERDPRYSSVHLFLNNGAILTVHDELYEGLRVDLIGPSEPAGVVVT